MTKPKPPESSKMATNSNFDDFHHAWVEQLHHLVLQLRSAQKQPSEHPGFLVTLVQRVVSHHAEYYRVKSVAASSDPISDVIAPWATSLERSLHWIAGWRPTTMFHLVYTESSLRFESQVVDILRGLRTGDLGDLSANQFREMSELQCQTVGEENAITDELAGWQDGADELLGPSTTSVEAMLGRLAAVIQKADDLRLRMIRKLMELLTPQQAVGFLIAASEMHFGVQNMGMEKDHQRAMTTSK